MSMFGFEDASKVFIYAKPTDMRKGFDGLFGLVVNHMDLDPRQGYLFVFMNRKRTLIKVLHWDRDGLALFYKRLEKGSFKRPTARVNVLHSELSKDELYMILRGIDFEKTKKRKRFLITN